MTLLNARICLHTVDKVVDQMRASNWDFYITGSRFYGGQTEESDWDFFTDEQSESCLGFLQSLGFEIVPYSRTIGEVDEVLYYDPSVRSVWSHPVGIHVQILYPGYAILKQKIQLCMSETPAYILMSKALRKRMWLLSWELLKEFRIIPTGESKFSLGIRER